MGRAAVAHADDVYVTDDNPRSEEPAEIRRAIMAGAPGAIEIAGRADAIAMATGNLKRGDVLLVAGKGHETGQIVGKTVIPYSDHEAVAAALAASTRGTKPWLSRFGPPGKSRRRWKLRRQTRPAFRWTASPSTAAL